MLYSTRAIVFRTVRYGETSLIADLFTEQKGLQTFVINSVRKAKATTPASFLQLMTLVDLVAYFHEQKTINRIKEVRLDVPYASIPFDRHKSAIVMCLAEICAKCIRTAEPHPALFDFLHERLVTLDRSAGRDNLFLLRFLTDLSGYLGFGLDLAEPAGDAAFFDLLEGQLTPVRPGHPYVLETRDYELLRAVIGGQPAVDYPDRQRLTDQLILYYQLHVESLREVNSVRILRDLFTA